MKPSTSPLKLSPNYTTPFNAVAPRRVSGRTARSEARRGTSELHALLVDSKSDSLDVFLDILSLRLTIYIGVSIHASHDPPTRPPARPPTQPALYMHVLLYIHIHTFAQPNTYTCAINLVFARLGTGFIGYTGLLAPSTPVEDPTAGDPKHPFVLNPNVPLCLEFT